MSAQLTNGQSYQFTAAETSAIYRAARIFERKLKAQDAPRFVDCGFVGKYLRCRLAALEHEEVHAFWLDTQHRLITAEVCSVGTLSQTCLYSREVAKAALRVNASALILAHNHPGGSCEPSPADVALTKHIRNTLSFIDVRVLDHFIVTNESIYSLTAGRLVQ